MQLRAYEEWRSRAANSFTPSLIAIWIASGDMSKEDVC